MINAKLARLWHYYELGLPYYYKDESKVLTQHIISIGTFIRRTQLLEAEGKKDNKQKVIAIIIHYRSVAKYGVILKRGGGSYDTSQSSPSPLNLPLTCYTCTCAARMISKHPLNITDIATGRNIVSISELIILPNINELGVGGGGHYVSHVPIYSHEKHLICIAYVSLSW